MNIFKNSVNQVFSILNIYIEEQKNIYPLQSVGNDYTVNENRQLVMIFLTDGFPTSKGHKAEYNNLKEKYPDIIINGIQYELGNYII